MACTVREVLVMTTRVGCAGAEFVPQDLVFIARMAPTYFFKLSHDSVWSIESCEPRL